MSLKTFIQNLRTDVAIAQEKNNASYQAAKQKTSLARMYAVPFALAFVFALAALASPASAGSLNDSISPIVSDMATLFVPILSLIIAAVPVIIAGAFISFMLGILGKILGMI